MIPIDKGVPVPKAWVRGRISRYPFPDMAVNDSFFVSTEDGGTQKRISTAAHCWARNHEPIRKFICRTLKEPSGVRCWRVE